MYRTRSLSSLWASKSRELAHELGDRSLIQQVERALVHGTAYDARLAVLHHLDAQTHDGRMSSEKAGSFYHAIGFTPKPSES